MSTQIWEVFIRGSRYQIVSQQGKIMDPPTLRGHTLAYIQDRAWRKHIPMYRVSEVEPRKITEGRNRRMYDLRKSGVSYHQIAKRYGCCAERVRQVCFQQERKIQKSLSQATSNIREIVVRRGLEFQKLDLQMEAALTNGREP